MTTDQSAQDFLVPRLEDIDEVDLSEVQWVLVVEKEASYPLSKPLLFLMSP